MPVVYKYIKNILEIIYVVISCNPGTVIFMEKLYYFFIFNTSFDLILTFYFLC